ncbi:Uncharacterised protein [Serratia quinivorans]|uniref:phage antirepressor KilAC domain-containing protein n=1 Tax=Serratia quinivorans TaxID=137545 RepID=UPI00217B3125|nr:phage antirepressor KilAC domain-containing protein [Serratia quinivorans]CAI1966676.1 Uncharacterised protein [Serratia quinivorans]
MTVKDKLFDFMGEKFKIETKTHRENKDNIKTKFRELLGGVFTGIHPTDIGTMFKETCGNGRLSKERAILIAKKCQAVEHSNHNEKINNIAKDKKSCLPSMISFLLKSNFIPRIHQSDLSFAGKSLTLEGNKKHATSNIQGALRSMVTGLSDLANIKGKAIADGRVIQNEMQKQQVEELMGKDSQAQWSRDSDLGGLIESANNLLNQKIAGVSFSQWADGTQNWETLCESKSAIDAYENSENKKPSPSLAGEPVKISNSAREKATCEVIHEAICEKANQQAFSDTLSESDNSFLMTQAKKYGIQPKELKEFLIELGRNPKCWPSTKAFEGVNPIKIGIQNKTPIVILEKKEIDDLIEATRSNVFALQKLYMEEYNSYNVSTPVILTENNKKEINDRAEKYTLITQHTLVELNEHISTVKRFVNDKVIPFIKNKDIKEISSEDEFSLGQLE